NATAVPAHTNTSVSCPSKSRISGGDSAEEPFCSAGRVTKSAAAFDRGKGGAAAGDLAGAGWGGLFGSPTDDFGSCDFSRIGSDSTAASFTTVRSTYPFWPSGVVTRYQSPLSLSTLS